MLSKIIEDWLNDILGTIQQWLIDSAWKITGSMENAFLLEKSVITPNVISDAYWYIYATCTLILIIKLLWKGGKVYIMYRDGDPEVSPMTMLTGAGMSLGVSVAFPVLYPMLVGVTIRIAQALVYAATGNWEFSDIQISDIVKLKAILELKAKTLSVLIAVVAYGIMLLVINYQLLLRGAELLIFRLGVPFASLDLVNSDGNIWKNYINILFRLMLLSIVQVFCMTIGLLLFESGTLNWAIAFELAAVSGPKIMAQFFPAQSGGLSQKAAAVASVARLVVH